MATRLEIYTRIHEQGLVPLFYHADADTGGSIARAIYEGGSRMLEFTNRGADALSAFSAIVRLARAHMPDMAVGIGSIEDAPTAALFLAHGADFVVGPDFSADVARLCNRRKIAYIPGCGSVTEIATAEEHGAEIVKLFPGGSVGGPDFVKSVLGPRPWTSIMPTGGVTSDEANLKAWFDAGVVAVGMGSNLVKADWVKAGEFQRIAAATSAAHAAIRAVRS
jgi:2-dehydro-3-deoxyphosphogluconate aldolase / (4S)-4-hydroxy-2-oxoglutarate aldolase